MKYVKFLFLGLIIFFVSCKTVSIKSLQPSYKLSHKLPYLELKFDVRSFYMLLNSRQRVVKFVIDNPDDSLKTAVLDQSANTYKVYMAKSLFEKAVKQNFCDYSPVAHGQIKCSLVSYLPTEPFPFLSALSVFSFYSLNLLGMPIAVAKAEVEVEFKILNSHGDLVADYVVYGKGMEPVGLYYGANLFNLKDITFLKAFRNALDSAGYRIEADYQEIVEKL